MPPPHDVVWAYILSHPDHPAVLELNKAQEDFDAAWNPIADRCDPSLTADSPEWNVVEPYQAVLDAKWLAVVALAEEGQK